MSSSFLLFIGWIFRVTHCVINWILVLLGRIGYSNCVMPSCFMLRLRYLSTRMRTMDILNRYKLSVSKRNLLLIAGIAWTVAGLILTGRGLTYLFQHGDFLGWWLAGGLLFGILFYILLFADISHRHIIRIRGLSVPYPCAFSFFGFRSYLMMALMISVGIILNRFDVINKIWLYNFYVTMGVPLLISASQFFYSWAANKEIA